MKERELVRNAAKRPPPVNVPPWIPNMGSRNDRGEEMMRTGEAGHPSVHPSITWRLTARE